jgi:hypothetical protein
VNLTGVAMTIDVKMPCCGRTGHIPDQYQGRRLQGTCPKCQGRFDITVPSLEGAPAIVQPVLPPAVNSQTPAKPPRSKTWALFYCLAKAVLKGGLNHLALGVPVGDWVVDGLDNWNKQNEKEAQRVIEIQAIAQATAEKVREAAEEAISSVAPQLPAKERELLKTYLTQIPSSIQRSRQTHNESIGTTILPGSLGSIEEQISLLPARMARYQAGDQPAGVGDWQLVELLGTGGFGEVWKARNSNLPNSRPVALKFCLDDKAASSLRHEAEMLDHVMNQSRRIPGIVPLLHTYLNANPPCLEYEYVDGGDLAGLIREWYQPPNQPGPLLVEEATHLMVQLIGVVAFAHRLKRVIVHRDLKPANILVQRSARGKVTLRVSDFGIGGVAASQSLAQAGTNAGQQPTLATKFLGSYTPLYASPQHARGEDPDPADDVYALGVIWYQLVTGDLTKGPPTGNSWSKRRA